MVAWGPKLQYQTGSNESSHQCVQSTSSHSLKKLFILYCSEVTSSFSCPACWVSKCTVEIQCPALDWNDLLRGPKAFKSSLWWSVWSIDHVLRSAASIRRSLKLCQSFISSTLSLKRHFVVLSSRHGTFWVKVTGLHRRPEPTSIIRPHPPADSGALPH